MTSRATDPLRDGTAREARVAEIEADVRRRLGQVCAGFPPLEFAALVRRIAEFTEKYEALAEARSVRVRTPPDPVPI